MSKLTLSLSSLAVAVLLIPQALPQDQPAGTLAWYNGDRQFGIPGYANWYVSSTQNARIYDDFVVPAGGWTVSAVFSNNTLPASPQVTQAAWEIRTGVAEGMPGSLIASGVDTTTPVFDAASSNYRVQVNGLQVPLPPGRYWLNVAPVGALGGQAYMAATLGLNAVGTPPGNDGGALNSSFVPISSTGSPGTSSEFSQGLYISGPAAAAPTTADLWKANLSTLATQLPALHSVPFPGGISLDQFNARISDLSNRIPTISDAEIRTGLQAIVAAIEDPHTDVAWSYPRPFRLLPLSFYWFDDGIYITAAPAQYQNLLGGKVLAVGDTPIDDAARILTVLVAHENDQWPKFMIPGNKLNNADFLFGLGLIPGTESASFQVETAAGDIVSTDVKSYGQMLLPRQIPLPQDNLPMYRQHDDRNYWFTLIDQGATLYFQYNSCMEDPKQPSAEFFQELNAFLALDVVQRVVLDMRNNQGGFSSILSPWIDWIESSRFNQQGRLYVIVGRATFSAAMEATDWLHDRTNAIFVGEPTGAKPQFQLRRGDFPLPNFDIRVSYSHGVESAKDSGPTLIPDIPTGLTFQQFRKGVDPALDAILAIPIPQ
jgi:hypothetical protein